MAKEINLLPEKKELTEKESSPVISSLRKLGIYLLAAAVVISLLAIIAGQLLVVIQSDTNSRINNVRQAVASFKEKEILFRVLGDKAGGITVALADRFDFPTVISSFLTLVPPEVAITKFTLGKEGDMAVTVRVPTAESVGLLLANLVDPAKGGKLFKGVYVESLVSDSDGSYKAVINLKYERKT